MTSHLSPKKPVLSHETPWLQRLYRRGLGMENFGVGFGVLLSLAALWPVYYGFYGRISRLDFEALSAGAIGLTIGASIAMWGVRARRHPAHAVWVDLLSRRVTVTSSDGGLRTAPLDKLGDIIVKKRRYRMRSRNGSRVVVSYGVLAPTALEDTRLFDDSDEAVSKAWAARLVRLAAVTGVQGLAFDEQEARAAESAFGAPGATAL